MQSESTSLKGQKPTYKAIDIGPNYNYLDQVEAQFENIQTKLDSNSITSISYLKHSDVKKYVLTPILSIFTLGFFALFLYWYPSLRKKFMYDQAEFRDADYLYICSYGNFNRNNYE